MAIGKARSSSDMVADARLRGWLGAYVLSHLDNGTPIAGNRMVRPERVKARFQEGRPNSFHVSPPQEMPLWVIVADGCKARLYNTRTREVSDPMTRAEALERIKELR